MSHLNCRGYVVQACSHDWCRLPVVLVCGFCVRDERRTVQAPPCDIYHLLGTEICVSAYCGLIVD